MGGGGAQYRPPPPSTYPAGGTPGPAPTHLIMQPHAQIIQGSAGPTFVSRERERGKEREREGGREGGKEREGEREREGVLAYNTFVILCMYLILWSHIRVYTLISSQLHTYCMSVYSCTRIMFILT